MALIGVSGKIGAGKDLVGKIIQYLSIVNMKDRSSTYFTSDFNDFVYRYESNLKNVSNWQIVKFADKLKECISIITGISREDLEKSEVKNSNLSSEWNKPRISEDMYGIQYISNIATPITVRSLLQLFGTEVGRSIHPDFWVNALFSEYKDIGYFSNEEATASDGGYYNKKVWNQKYPNWIITDMRFLNELKAVKDRGGITIRCSRKQLIKTQNCTVVYDPKFDSKEHLSETVLDNATFDYYINNNGTIEELIVMVKDILIKERII